MLQKEKVHWKCLVGGAKKWKAGEHLIKEIKQDETIVELKASMLEKRSDCFLIELNWNDVNLSFAELLYIAGEIPLPPYLNRVVEEHDKKTYQTVYARNDGSVAAPTAGLHFTENLFRKLSEKNIAKDFVTLHVGAGTFKPVKSETMEGHEMHAEFIDVSIETINNIINHLDKTIIAVGTTSLRTIESLYWMGVKVNEELKVKSEELNEGLLTIKQWEAYELPQDISAIAALSALTKWMQQHNMQKIIAKTQIIIAPGYDLRIAKGLLTNFHQPKSTLLLLVAAIVGDDWKKIYNHALENNFRFLSYGDGCLLWKREV
jgi:S-adenosylmethionine:tRNA ribosyltransferase-isomerase